MMINAYCNFFTSSFVTTSWWSLHTATFTLSSFVITSWWSLHTATFTFPLLLLLHDDHYIPQLFNLIVCYNFMMIITYRNFSFFYLCYNLMIIYTYRNFLPFSCGITWWWSLRTPTFPLPRMLKLHDDHYIPQLFHFLLCYNFMVISTYRNFRTSSFVIV